MPGVIDLDNGASYNPEYNHRMETSDEVRERVKRFMGTVGGLACTVHANKVASGE